MASLTTLQVTLGAAATQATTTPILFCRWVTVQNNATHACRVGDSNVSSTRGIALAAAGGTVTFGYPGVVLSDIYISGTAADVIDIVYVLG